MLPIKTILHASDFSRGFSTLPCRPAGALARDYGARLVILHVGRPPLRPGGPLAGTAVARGMGAGRCWSRRCTELHRRSVPGLEGGPEYRLEFADGVSDEVSSAWRVRSAAIWSSSARTAARDWPAAPGQRGRTGSAPRPRAPSLTGENVLRRRLLKPSADRHVGNAHRPRLRMPSSDGPHTARVDSEDAGELPGIPFEEMHHPEAYTGQKVAQRAQHFSGHRVAKVVVVMADGRPVPWCTAGASTCFTTRGSWRVTMLGPGRRLTPRHASTQAATRSRHHPWPPMARSPASVRMVRPWSCAGPRFEILAKMCWTKGVWPRRPSRAAACCCVRRPSCTGSHRRQPTGELAIIRLDDSCWPVAHETLRRVGRSAGTRGLGYRPSRFAVRPGVATSLVSLVPSAKNVRKIASAPPDGLHRPVPVAAGR